MNMIWRGIFVVILTAATVAACLLSPSANLGEGTGIQMDGEEIRALPMIVLDYTGIPQDPGEREKELLPKDTRFEKMLYMSMNQSRYLACQIVLAGADSRSIHRPEICLPTQGWTIRERYEAPITVSGRELEVTVLIVSREEQDREGRKFEVFSYNVYWFVGKDFTTASHKERILRTSLDNIFRNVNHRWGYVTVNAPIASPHGPAEREAALNEIRRFIAEIVPSIQVGW